MHPRRFLRVFACATSLALLLAGCAAPASPLPAGTRVIITTGLEAGQLFRIEDLICTTEEYLVYLINLQKLCEKGLGPGLWETAEGGALAESVKGNALARVSRVKVMRLMAAAHGISLTEEEVLRADAAADAYDASLSEADRAAMGGVELSTLRAMAEEYALANKVYRYLIRDIDPEVSDDEARRVTVRQILLRTWSYDADGTRRSFSSSKIRGILARAVQLRQQWEEGADFASLAASWDESGETVFSFGRGERDPLLEEAAFSMATGEVSAPIQTEDGIVLLYMVRTLDRAETDANKLRIMEERRRDTFDREYEQFAAGLARTFHDAAYERIDLSPDPAVTTDRFFQCCEEACGETGIG